MNIKRLIYGKYSKIIISIIIGFGLATIFRRICNESDCLEFRAPVQKKLEDTIYKEDNHCFKFNYRNTRCDNNKKKIPFA